LDFLAELCKLDVTIGDLSLGNFTILDGQFKYFDFGSLSFSKINMNNVIAYWLFCINILHLFSKSQTKKAYMYLSCDCTKEAGPNKNDILLYLNDSEKSRYETTYDNSLTLVGVEPMRVLSDLREYAVSIDVECKASSFWHDAQKAYFASGVDNRDEMFLKYKVTLDFIEKVRPRTFIDLAGNSAYLAIAAKDLFEYGVSADYDIDASDDAWGNVKKYNAGNVIPVVFDFMCPTPPRHNGLVSFGKNVIPTNKDGFTRYKSDCAVCLSVIHHKIFQQLYTISEIIGTLAQYTNKWLIVEYIDRNCFSVKNYLQKFDWYTKKTFEDELSKLFDIVEAKITLYDNNRPTRYTYLCLKK
jgi:hypothetical protein